MHSTKNGKHIRWIRDVVAGVIEREALEIVFQPIVDLRTAEIVGLEALTRPASDTLFRHPAELFEAAEQVEMLPALESVLRRIAFGAASAWPSSCKLFLNNSPAVFAADDYLETVVRELDAVPGLDPRQVVLELTERTHQEMDAGFGARALLLRERGFQIAIDDVGAGTSGLNRLMALRPNWIKLDLELISGIDADPLKQNLIRFFVRFASLSNMGLVAEGVERHEELAVLIELGVTHGQGFFLGRPGRADQTLSDDVRETILALRSEANRRLFRDPSTIRVGSLVSPAVTCQKEEPVGDVLARLGQPSPGGVVVLDHRRFMGWASERDLRAWCESRSARAPVGTAPITGSTMVGADVTLAEAMEVVASRPEDVLPCPLVVQDESDIAGVVSLRRLLLAMSEAHRGAPPHTEPLTGLPSRVQADRWIADRIRAGDPAHVAFIDLRNFDAYNLAYGFEMGDGMLRQLTGLIHAHLVDGEDGATFVAHLGEDRFLVGFRSDPHAQLERLVTAFVEARKEFFTPVDIAAAAFSYVDPAGNDQTFPLTTVRIVLVEQAARRVAEPRELHQLARELRMRSERSGVVPAGIITDRRRPAATMRASA